MAEEEKRDRIKSVTMGETLDHRIYQHIDELPAGERRSWSSAAHHALWDYFFGSGKCECNQSQESARS